jgi:hypothetical protein
VDLDDVARIFRTNMTRLVVEAAARRRAIGRLQGPPVGAELEPVQAPDTQAA